MNRFLKIAGVLAAVGVLVGGVIVFLPDGDDNRPPIFVRGGSLILETQRPLKGSGKNWKVDHNDGVPANYFLVNFTPVGSCVLQARGTQVVIRYSIAGSPDVMEVQLKGKRRYLFGLLGQRDPNMQATKDMTYTEGGTTGLSKLEYGAQTGGSIQVSVQTPGGTSTVCDVTGAEIVAVEN